MLEIFIQFDKFTDSVFELIYNTYLKLDLYPEFLLWLSNVG